MQYLQILAIALSYVATGFLGDWARNTFNNVLDFFTISPEESTQASQTIESFIDFGFDGQWKEFLEGRNAVAEAVLGVCVNPIALLLFPFRGVSLIATFVVEGLFSPKTIRSIASVLAIVLVLKAGIHAEGCYLLRIVTNQAYSAVMSATTDGLTTQAKIEQMNLTQGLESNLYSRLEECKSLPTNGSENSEEVNPKQQCQDKAFGEVEKEAQEYNSKNAEEGFSIDFELIKKGVQTGLAVASFPHQVLFTAIAQTIEIAFLAMIEVTFLLSAYISPIFLVFSILPGESKMTHGWFSAWFCLSLLKVSYAIALGVIAQAFASHPIPNPMFLPLMNGLLAPLMAVIFAAGGGIAFFSVTSEVVSGGVRLVIGAVTGKIR